MHGNTAPGPVIRSSRTPAAIRTTLALILREMVTTYGRSPGGYLWAILEPVAVISLFAFVFSLAFRAPSLGSSFGLFYASGYLPYILFHDVSNKTANALRFSQPLLAFSAVTWLDAILARFILNFLTQVLVTTLVLLGLITLLDIDAHIEVSDLGIAMAMAGLLALGVGLLNSYLYQTIPVWERVWSVLTRPLFLISGVFFLFEDLPIWLQDVLWFNPLFHATGLMRTGLYPFYGPTYVNLLFPFGIALALILLGLLLGRIRSDDLS